MAKESEERKRVKEHLVEKGEKVSFPLFSYLKVARMLNDMNRVARIERLVEKDDVLYSIRQEGASEGYFYVIRNY